VKSTTPAIAGVVEDFGQLQQVLMNFVINARDAMPNGGQMLISIQAREVHTHGTPESPSSKWRLLSAMLMVRDTGCGMTPEVRAVLPPSAPRFFTALLHGLRSRCPV